MTTRLHSSRRAAATLVVAIGLLGACAVLVVLIDAPAGPGQPGPARARRAAPAALAPADLAPLATAPLARAGGAKARSGHAAALASPAAAEGARLMSQAAAACGAVAFHGTQIAQVTAGWGASGRSASVLQVWHRPGGSLVAQPARTGASSAVSRAAERQPDPSVLEGQGEVMTLTLPLVSLMQSNYVLTYDGSGTVDGRPAQVVAVRRPGGGLAARFWIDASTKLPLRRELFDSQARVFSDDAFIGLSVGNGQLEGAPAADALPAATRLTGPELAALRASGWPVPRLIAGGLALFSATQTRTKSGKVVDLSYSDGLSVISVFLERGELPRSMPGWTRTGARGSDVYAVDGNDRGLAWSSGGLVFTVISDAPTATVQRAVAGLPHDAPPDFWDRLGRGFRRMASWVNPFG